MKIRLISGDRKVHEFEVPVSKFGGEDLIRFQGKLYVYSHKDTVATRYKGRKFVYKQTEPVALDSEDDPDSGCDGVRM